MWTRADQAESEYELSSAKRDWTLTQLKFYQLLGHKVEKTEGQIEVHAVEKPDLDLGLKHISIQKKQILKGILSLFSLISQKF